MNEKEAVAEVLDTAPLGIGNLARVYNPQYGTLDQRINLAQLDDPTQFICSLLLQAKQPLSTCSALKPVFDLLPKLPAFPALSARPRARERRAAEPRSGGQDARRHRAR